MERRYRYRLCVFDDPRDEWRATYAEAMGDAVRADLASYDESRREHYLAVPVRIEREEVG